MSYQAGLLAGAALLYMAVWLIIAVALCVWMYKDAKSRGMSAGLWLVVGLVLGIIGLIVYLVVRKPKLTTVPRATVTT